MVTAKLESAIETRRRAGKLIAVCFAVVRRPLAASLMGRPQNTADRLSHQPQVKPFSSHAVCSSYFYLWVLSLVVQFVP